MSLAPTFSPSLPLPSPPRPSSTPHNTHHTLKRPPSSRPSLPSKRLRPTSTTSHPPTPRSLLSTYTPAPFQPYPSRNPHLQTIIANFYPPAPPLPYTRISLPSDDSLALLHIDLLNAISLSPSNAPITLPSPIPAHSHPSSYAHLPRSPPVAVLLHGLESNARAIVSSRLAHALSATGFKTASLNFRSCAGDDDLPATLRLYHAGFTDDLETLLRALEAAALADRRHPPDVYLCGFSLGANIVCQFLGKWGVLARHRFHVVAAAGACVPFDPVACQRRLDSGWRGVVYSSRLVATMQRKFDKAVQRGVDVGACEPEKVRKARRIGSFDEAYIAPTFGFKDRMDYYRKVDSRKVLKRIAVPTYLINARDDPFFDHACGRSLPTPEQIGNSPVLLHITEHGGHCGFLDRQAFKQNQPCYFQREFARFFAYVRDARSRASNNGSDVADAQEQVSVDANTDPG